MAERSSTERVLDPTMPARRSVLDWLLGLWGTGVVASVLYPVLHYLVPPEIPEAATQTANAGPASTLPPDSARIVPFGSAPAIIVRDASGEYRAFAATCTHLACTVQYRGDLQHIWCACHNGHYDLRGRNVAGPPPRPLEEYDVNVREDQLVLSRRA